MPSFIRTQQKSCPVHFTVDDVRAWAQTYSGKPYHAIICDPPREISFMGRKWDNTGIAFQSDTWAAIGEHLLAGAYGMAFGGLLAGFEQILGIEMSQDYVDIAKQRVQYYLSQRK